MSTNRKIAFLSTVLILGAIQTVRAQEDTLSGIRRFIRVCNLYKQLPLSLEVAIQRKTSFITDNGASSQLAATFCLRPDGSYIFLEGTEQLANDSLLLVVNKVTKRMILYPNHQSVAARFRQYLGFRFADSSVRRVAGAYRASTPALFRDTATIEVISRIRLPHTELPVEEVLVKFNSKTDEPYEVMEIKRSLVPVSKAIYEKSATLPEWTGKVFNARDSLYFAVKEQAILFRYRNISHDPAGKLPFRVSDRIAAEVPGKYRPVGEFADYVLTQQF
jgi:hypothetical protein